MNLEIEISEHLYNEMKSFLGSNPNRDQCILMKSTLANFLFQNGSENSAVRERYMKDLLSR